MLNTLNSVSLIMTTLRTGTVVLLLFLVAQVCEPLFFFQLYCILIKTQKSLKALFLNFQTFLQGTHIEPVGTHCEPPYLSPWLTKYSFKLCFFPFSSKYSIFFPWSQFKIHLFSKLNSPFIIRVSGTAFIAFHIFWAQLGHALKSF